MAGTVQRTATTSLTETPECIPKRPYLPEPGRLRQAGNGQGNPYTRVRRPTDTQPKGCLPLGESCALLPPRSALTTEQAYLC